MPENLQLFDSAARSNSPNSTELTEDSKPPLLRLEPPRSTSADLPRLQIAFAEQPALPRVGDLVDTGTGILEVVRPAVENSMRHIFDTLQKLAETRQGEWTVAVNLTTDFGRGHGVPDRMKQFNEFAAQTKDKNITIVVQAAYPELKNDGTKSDRHRLERYVIRNGEINKVETVPSKGYGEDVESFLKFTTSRHPARRMGLVIDSHGMGNRGLVGDTGRSSLEGFVNSVRAGLKDSGRDKLDLIDFDCCLMAQDGVMDRLRQVTDHVVASAETESTEGQALIPALSHLVTKPDTDARALSRNFIEQTRRQTEVRVRDGGRVPIETLSHVNLAGYEDFRTSLDAFGDKLFKAIDDPTNRRAVERAIDDTTAYGTRGGGSFGLLMLIFGGENTKEYRDLKEFTEKVVAAIDNKQISDADGSLRQSANKLLERQRTLVESNHAHGSYRNTGGLSVFLPDNRHRSPEYQARMRTSAGRIAHMCDARNFASVNQNSETRTNFVNQIAQETTALRARTVIFFTTPAVEAVKDDLAGLDSAVKRFTDAATDADREKAMQGIRGAAEAMERNPYFRTERDRHMDAIRQRSASAYQAHLVLRNDSGWNRFRLKLKDTN